MTRDFMDIAREIITDDMPDVGIDIFKPRIVATNNATPRHRLDVPVDSPSLAVAS